SASIAGVPVLPLALPHGDHEVFGYRIGAMAYLTDVKVIPTTVIEELADLEVLVLNALLSRPHPLHLSVPEAVAVAQRIGARRTRSEEHTSELQSRSDLVCRLLLEKKKTRRLGLPRSSSACRPSLQLSHGCRPSV